MSDKAPRTYIGFIPNIRHGRDEHHFDQLNRLRPQDTLLDFDLTDTESGRPDTDQQEAAQAIDRFGSYFGLDKPGWSRMLTRIISNAGYEKEKDPILGAQAERNGDSLGSFITRLAWWSLPIENYTEEEGSSISVDFRTPERWITIAADGQIWLEGDEEESDVGWKLEYSAQIEPNTQSST